ncbi:MAG: NUDIX domain-containing protein [Patescibacteria group bacterium]|nr:NUDIX domain-containing protein [Patescibacteria group bacterium]
MKTRIIVCASSKKDNYLLFGQKKPGVGPYPDIWHLLGGGVKEDEILTDAIKREIREESNIEIEVEKSLGFDEDYEPDKNNEMTHYIFLTFLTKYVSGETRAGDDIEKIKWIEKENISQIKLSRPAEKLFKELKYI